MTTKTHFEILR